MEWILGTFAVCVALWGASTDTIRRLWVAITGPEPDPGSGFDACYLQGGRRRRRWGRGR